MSYILDALRKADADRERDPSRGIHAHPVAIPGSSRRQASWPVVAGGAGGLVLAAAVVWLWPSGQVQQPVAVAPAAPVAAPQPAPVLPPAPPPEPVVARAPAAPAPAASAAERIHAVAELPAEVQRDLPKLAISGGVYSDNASQRMLIVGGQVANEGAEVAPGLVLEQIRPKSAVLRYRGFRYSVAY